MISRTRTREAYPPAAPAHAGPRGEGGGGSAVGADLPVALVAGGGPCYWTDRPWETDGRAARIARMLAVPELSRLPARPGLWSPVEGVRGPEDWPARRRTIRAAWRR